MAIKRCPYCRSIIDEVDRYCNSCGTQLLFPEDEEVEEDIPGERIVEAEDKLPEEDVEISAREEEIEPEPLPEPPPVEDELPSLLSRAKKETVIPDLKLPPEEPPPPPDIPWKFATSDLPEMEQEPPAPPKLSRAEPLEAQPEPSKPSEEFEAGFPTSAEESDEIARLMSALEKQAPRRTPSPPAPREPEPELEPEEVPFSEKDLPPLRFEEGKPPTSDELPPWAERVKNGVTPGFRSAEEDEFSRDLADLNLDIDEEPRLGPAPALEPGDLAFGEDGLRRQAEADLHPRPRRRRRKHGSRVKARLYDVLMITLLWAAALWASAKVVGVSFFDIVINSAPQVGAFFLILLAGYFALFFSFLGETLGDRLGSPPA